MRFIGRSLINDAGLRGSPPILTQEAVEAFHRSGARSTFDEILKGLSRRSAAGEIMERVAGEEVVRQVWNVVTVLHLPEDHPVTLGARDHLPSGYIMITL